MYNQIEIASDSAITLVKNDSRNSPLGSILGSIRVLVVSNNKKRLFVNCATVNFHTVYNNFEDTHVASISHQAQSFRPGTKEGQGTVFEAANSLRCC